MSLSSLFNHPFQPLFQPRTGILLVRPLHVPLQVRGIVESLPRTLARFPKILRKRVLYKARKPLGKSFPKHSGTRLEALNCSLGQPCRATMLGWCLAIGLANPCDRICRGIGPPGFCSGIAIGTCFRAWGILSPQVHAQPRARPLRTGLVQRFLVDLLEYSRHK